MSATLSPPPPAPQSDTTSPGGRLRSWVRTDTTVGRRRVLGLIIFAVVFALFFTFNRFPKLDVVREDVDIATTEARRAAEDLPVIGGDNRCFQGFCVEPDKPFLERWWDFSVTYLGLVTVGMIFAFLVAGLAEALLFPRQGAGAFGRRRGLLGSLQGLAVGPAMNLCSACIVPVANSFRKQGADVEATVAITQGSATMNAPAIIMAFAIFSPLLAGSRVVLSVIGALLLGPLVGWVVHGRYQRETVPNRIGLDAAVEPPKPWPTVVVDGIRDWLVAAWRFFIRLGPIMVVAGFVSGAAIQLLTPETVERFLGNHLLGVTIAATFGILINVPLLFEIPLVAALMLLGMGTAPAAALLFAAAAGGPITFWGLAKAIPGRGIAALAAGTWLLAGAGGAALLVTGAVEATAAATPVVTFDGEQCTYDGPDELPTGQTTFAVRNDAPKVDRVYTLGVAVGLLPEGGQPQLQADLRRNPAELPADFIVAGEHNFVHPGDTEVAPMTMVREGRHGVVCSYGGGYYVVAEFSMPQGPGWFEEFRSTFQPYVAPETFLVAAD